MDEDERVIRLFGEIRDLQRQHVENARGAIAESAGSNLENREISERRAREAEEDTDRHLAGIREQDEELSRRFQEDFADAIAAARAAHTETRQALIAEQRRQRTYSIALTVAVFVNFLLSLS
jgi:hypothetical protein